MPTSTEWIRLEPHIRNEEMPTTLQARVHDPLWLLARQWQLGEFLGEDAGSPISARIRVEGAPITRYHAGPLPENTTPTAQPYNIRKPLEALVEHEYIRNKTGTRRNFRTAAEAGLHFLRLLQANGLGNYRETFLDQFALQLPEETELAELDAESSRFFTVMAGRAPDGILLYHALNEGMQQQPVSIPGFTARDLPKAIQTAKVWLDWYEALFSEPEPNQSAWIPERMEYAFAVSGYTADGEKVLTASEYQEGHLDWYSFNLRPDTSLGASPDDAEKQEIVRTVIPAPVYYDGMPAARWWEFEDAQVNFGAIDAEPVDLAGLITLEFALSYSNDWFIIPVDLAVGAIYHPRSLVVTDTFGMRTLIRPYSVEDRRGDSESGWRMFCTGVDRYAGTNGVMPADDFLFLPPVLPTSLNGAPLEEVLLLRDEMSNLAWAVERVVESPTGRPLDRHEAYQEKRRREAEKSQTPPPAIDTPLAYYLSTSVPEYWIPLIPVRMTQYESLILSTSQIMPGDPSIRLRRGKLLHGSDGDTNALKPLGRILEPDRSLSIFEEEIPRVGACVTRAYQYTRWVDGSTYLWIGRRKRPGRGEGYSGLRFDVVKESASNPS